ncbi:hypothetical protein LCGC14_3010070 [marine sediment metagenome]|uniref:Uncharacterized protein n=1 Tax=marine sediment metagenome TaxID=412755 RepID=A0A0F8WYZ0_9ZZZZ
MEMEEEMKRTILMIGILISLFFVARCSREPEINSRPPYESPKVTIDKDGNSHIDRLDPGESVVLEFELIIPREEKTDDKKTVTDKYI